MRAKPKAKAQPKSIAPKIQTMKSTPANRAERKTARPSPRSAKIDSPAMPIAPPALERKRSPKI